VLALVPVLARVAFGGDLRPAASVFALVCICLAVATLLMARQYRRGRLEYEVDPEAATLRVVPSDELRSRMEGSPFATSKDLRAELNEVSRVNFFTLPGYVVARVRYPGGLPGNPYALVVPRNRYSVVESALRATDVPVSSNVGLSPMGQLRARWRRFAVLFVSTCVLLFAPVAVVVTIVLTPMW
jgi:hypothetical protein